MKFAVVWYEGESMVVCGCESSTKLLLLQKAAEKAGKGIPGTLLECIQAGEEFIDTVKEITASVEMLAEQEQYFVEEASVEFRAPIEKPLKNIFCVGKNYAEHAIEMGSAADIPEHIMMFTKAPTTVIGHGAGIPCHADVTSQLDYEGELAVIIGKKGVNIKSEEALDHVFGYTIINDVTARDLQAKHKQFFLGKSLDGTCPMGPYAVHKSTIPNPNQLTVETKVNDEVRQNSNTSQFIFPVEEIISIISKGMTLEPGDIIATGTPAGVGKGFTPPKFLQPGDTIEITVGEIGTLKNTVKA